MGFRRLIRAVAVVVATTAAIGATGMSTASGGAYQTAPWETEGTVVSTGAPAPNVQGATGSFVLDDLTRTGGGDISGAMNENGEVTVYVQPNTVFLDDHDNDGEYRKATQAQVVVPGERVFVAGRFHRADGDTTLFANYVWNPPIEQLPPPSPPNPTPQDRGDYLMNRLFGVTARVTEPGTTAVGTIGWNKFNGFTIGFFTDYGCGQSPGCHVQAVAAAHNDRLRIHTTPLTTYWEGVGGGQYRKSTDRYRVVEVLGSQQGVSVSGRYTWDGTDWRFIASHVFAPPPTESAPGGPTGPYTATMHQDSEGTYDEVAGIWRQSQWTGTMDPGGRLGLARVTMTLDWHRTTSGHWEFAGTYSIVAPAPSQTSLAGEISGSVPAGATLSPFNAVTSVAQATGDWNGWSGFGTAQGGATYTPGTTGDVTPPVEARATFQWRLVPPG
jgi:hypothetical protein